MASVARRWWLRSWLAVAVAFPAAAHAEPFRPRELPTSDAYQISFELRRTHATRSEFDEALFLFAQPVERIVADQLSLALELRYALAADLELSATLSVAHRTAAARFSPVVLSPEQSLPPVWIELENQGFLDPELGARYRVFELGPLAFDSRLGVTLPSDDNSAGQTLPKKLPLSTGQPAIRLAPRLSLAFERLFFALDYELGYHPRAAAAYLVRRVDNQSYANGALDDFFTHDFRLSAALRANPVATFELGLFGAVAQNPAVIQGGRELAFVHELLRYELGATAAVRLQLSRRHSLALAYDAPFVRAWESDPFFPIALPEQGLCITWSLTGS